MKSKQIMFFAMPNDIRPIIEEVEALINVKYYVTGMFENRDVIEYKSLSKKSEISQTTTGDWNYIDDYIILPEESILNVRVIPQRKGGKRFAIDQLNNSKSIVIKLGGIYTKATNVLIAGRAGTISEEGLSLELYSMFASKIKRSFKKRVGMFYVGPEALQMLKEGWRLVTDVRNPTQSDFKYEHVKPVVKIESNPKA